MHPFSKVLDDPMKKTCQDILDKAYFQLESLVGDIFDIIERSLNSHALHRKLPNAALSVCPLHN